MLSSQRPRNVGWLQAGGLLFGDWGTSRLYVLGLAFFFARGTSFYLILAMSALILAIGWGYTQICRIYPDGGGVYTAAKHKSRTLAVVGALLLFADYTVTASLSVLDAFHYFGLKDPGTLFSLHSPGFWAIIAILAIGAFSLMGPKHTGSFALLAAIGMILITLLVTFGALPQVNWRLLPSQAGGIHESPRVLWTQFVSIVLALSGVEAIANLTGVMKKPVAATARKAIWVVALEVAIFNILLGIVMIAIVKPADYAAHKEDMLAYLSLAYMGPWAERAVRMIGGLLLLSAGNTAITDMISVQYLMARDGELPMILQRLNRFGVPWAPAIVAAAVPAIVLVISHDLEHLAALYAIGLIGAVAINITLCATHPRLHRWKRKVPMMLLGILLMAIWVTLALTKLHALAFVCIVLAAGLTARAITRWQTRRAGVKPSLLRQAIIEQLAPEALSKPKMMIGTYGSELLAPAAMAMAKAEGMTLVVCFVRVLNLSIKWETSLSIDTDQAAQKTFARFLELAHDAGVVVMPVYDTGPDAAELMAENAAVYGCQRVIIGTSRRGAMYQLVKGSFHRRLEHLLPPDVEVRVVDPMEAKADGSEPVAEASPPAP